MEKSGLGMFASLRIELSAQSWHSFFGFQDSNQQTMEAYVFFMSCILVAADLGILRDMLH